MENKNKKPDAYYLQNLFVTNIIADGKNNIVVDLTYHNPSVWIEGTLIAIEYLSKSYHFIVNTNFYFDQVFSSIQGVPKKLHHYEFERTYFSQTISYSISN